MAVLDLALILLLLQIVQVAGYKDGAPLRTCFTQYPEHEGAATQTTPCPYTVTFNPSKYRPGENIEIKVVSTNIAYFEGIQMIGRRTTDNRLEIVGRFVDHGTNETKSNNCFGGYQNVLTHSTNAHVENITVTWLAPSDNVGDITFTTTFVKSFKTFWHAVETVLPVDNVPAPVTQAKYPAVPLNTLTKPINFDDCGDIKGCFYYPKHCTGSDCKAVATYKHRESTKDFLFELYLNRDGPNWVSIGFSDDDRMGNDMTLTCTAGVEQMSVQEGHNIKHVNERLLNLHSSGHEILDKDGKIHCRFVLPETMSLYSVDQSITNAFRYTNRDWDLLKDWYLFIAWGNTMPDSNTLREHSDWPVVSREKVDLTENVIIFTSTLHVYVQVHATLMILAWVLFAGIVTVISRHYRVWFEKSTMCGSPAWFQIHRTLAILVICLTLAGIIVIFAHYGTGIRDLSTPHAYVGLAVVGCMGLQLIGGMLRPHMEHSLRPLFNFVHRFTGHAAHILAAATMFLAYQIKYIGTDMRKSGIIVLSVWVGVQVFWHLMFEIIKRYRSKGSSSSCINDDDESKPEAGGKSTDDCPHTTTLVTYILTLMGLTAWVILPIYQY